jgi:hypothetical protein
VVEVVEGARVEASMRCSNPQTQQQLVEDSSRTVAVDSDGRRHKLQLSRSGQGWRRRRLQLLSRRSRSGQGWRRRKAAAVALRAGVATASSFSNIGSGVHARTAGGAEADRAPARRCPAARGTTAWRGGDTGRWLDHEQRPSGVSTKSEDDRQGDAIRSLIGRRKGYTTAARTLVPIRCPLAILGSSPYLFPTWSKP